MPIGVGGGESKLWFCFLSLWPDQHWLDFSFLALSQLGLVMMNPSCDVGLVVGVVICLGLGVGLVMAVYFSLFSTLSGWLWSDCVYICLNLVVVMR